MCYYEYSMLIFRNMCEEPSLVGASSADNDQLPISKQKKPFFIDFTAYYFKP